MERYTKIFVCIALAFIIFLGGLVAIKTYDMINNIVSSRNEHYKSLE